MTPTGNSKNSPQVNKLSIHCKDFIMTSKVSGIHFPSKIFAECNIIIKSCEFVL